MSNHPPIDARELPALIPAAFFRLDAQGRVMDVNALACALLGVSRDVLTGRSFSHLLPPPAQPNFASLLRLVLGATAPVRREMQVLHADGRTLDVQLDALAVDRHGAGNECHLILTDITLFKAAHRTLLDSREQLDAQVQARDVRIRAVSAELETVLTAFLQQMNLPVARALNFVALLRRALPEGDEVVNRALLNAERAVQAIFALGVSLERYLQGRRLRVRLRRVNLNVVLREVLKKEQPALVDRTVDIASDPLPVVQGDSQALMLIIDEYVANAIKFTKMRPAARIRIVARETDTEFHIGVEDNGAGFNMRQKDKLFTLFGRLHSSSVYEGSGIGLTNVRRLCERFGGRVWAEGKVDVGATFWFAWPKQPTLLES